MDITPTPMTEISATQQVTTCIVKRYIQTFEVSKSPDNKFFQTISTEKREIYTIVLF